MVALPEDDTFPEEVRRIETTDPVLGGPPNEANGDGLSNIGPMQLAKRTRWLKNRVDSLLAAVVAATTAAAGIVKLSSATNSASVTEAATPSAVKAAMDAANARALATRTINAGGLATGGGDLSADRVITVPIATQVEAEAGALDTKALTPLRAAQAMTKRLADLGLPVGIMLGDLNDAPSGVSTGATPANSPISNPVVLTMRRDNQYFGQMLLPAFSADPEMHIRSTAPGGALSGWKQVWSGISAANSLAASGYQRLPSGLILQWGQFSGVTLAANVAGGVFESDTIAVTWPTAFSTAVYQVICGCSTDVAGYGQQEQAWRRGTQGLTSGQFAVAARTSGATIQGSFLAIGR